MFFYHFKVHFFFIAWLWIWTNGSCFQSLRWRRWKTIFRLTIASAQLKQYHKQTVSRPKFFVFSVVFFVVFHCNRTVTWSWCRVWARWTWWCCPPNLAHLRRSCKPPSLNTCTLLISSTLHSYRCQHADFFSLSLSPSFWHFKYRVSISVFGLLSASCGYVYAQPKKVIFD